MIESTGSLNIISSSVEDTFSIGRIIGENLSGGDILALIGELGAGKTTITQGIARGLGVSDRYQITSPTFTLINEYEGNYKLYHFDLYRLQDSRDMQDVCYEEYFYAGGVCVIEWADKIKDLFTDEMITVSFSYLDDNQRSIVISGNTSKIKQLSTSLKSGGF
jgi:tRNA threonylcarbamoyladenosine biosynthesis protein TsaE